MWMNLPHLTSNVDELYTLDHISAKRQSRHQELTSGAQIGTILVVSVGSLQDTVKQIFGMGRSIHFFTVKEFYVATTRLGQIDRQREW